jgi:peptide/nickel transport system ATP-binding protein
MSAPSGPSAFLTPEFPKAALEARGLVRRFGARVAVDDVSFRLDRGRTLGIVGESGSGKTTIARLALGLDTASAGTIERHGTIGAIYQDALSSFDPRLTVQQILSDALTGGRSRRASVTTLLDRVGLPSSVATRNPRVLSGGQQQRVSIARAIAAHPDILICDEPVSSLDVIAQAQVLDLLDELQRDLGLSLVFISHDLGVVRHMSDDVLVMRDGEVLEAGPTEQVFADPQHAYTRALIDAAPTLV